MLGAHQGGHAAIRFLEGSLVGSLKEVLLRRALRRRLLRVFSADEVLRRVLRRGGCQKVLRRQKHVLSQSTTPFACTCLMACLLKMVFSL